MAGVLIHDVSGYSESTYNLKIPSLTDPANIQEAMMLFHYGIDNYDGSIEPADDSVFGNLRDFDNRIAQLEDTAVVSLSGTENEIGISASVGFVTLSLPDELIAPDNLTVSNNFNVSGSASIVGDILVSGGALFSGEVDLDSGLTVGNSASIDNNLIVGSSSANYLNVTGSASFTEPIIAKKGINVFSDDSERDSLISSPATGTIVYLLSTNQQLVYNGNAWIAIESGSGLEDIFLLMGA